MKEYDVVGVEAWQMKQNFQPTRRIKSESEFFSYVGCGGMMIKKEVVEDISLFDTQFNPKYFEDPDFCFRAIQNGYKVGWCVDKVIEHQKHDLTLSKEERVFFMRNLRIMQDKWREFPLPKVKMKGTSNG
jgi:GT2 family glycosyltransferase